MSYRPEINQDLFDKINKLSNEANVGANHIVNLLVKVGLEALSRSIDIIKDEINIKMIEQNESKESARNKTKNPASIKKKS